MANNDFGELRQLLNQPKLDRKSFWSLVETKANESPEVYFDQWLPYIQSFPHHFEGIYEHCLSMTLVERYARILPHLALGLSINAYSALGSKGTQALAKNPLLAHVRSLYLEHNRIGVHGLKALMQSPYIKQLERLSLSENAIQDRGAREIANSTQFGALNALELNDNKLTGEGLVALAQSDGMASLVSLAFSWNTLDVPSLESFVDVQGFPSLKTLELYESQITDEVLACLSQSAYLRGVTSLDLGDNAISQMEMLVHGDALADLEMLTMQTNSLDDDGFIAWCDAAKMSKLRVLDVSDNRIGDASLETLAHSPAGSTLEILHCNFTDVSDDGVRALASATMLARLQHVFLDETELAPETVEALADSSALPSLKTIQYGRFCQHRVRD